MERTILSFQGESLLGEVTITITQPNCHFQLELSERDCKVQLNNWTCFVQWLKRGLIPLLIQIRPPQDVLNLPSGVRHGATDRHVDSPGLSQGLLLYHDCKLAEKRLNWRSNALELDGGLRFHLRAFRGKYLSPLF